VSVPKSKRNLIFMAVLLAVFCLASERLRIVSSGASQSQGQDFLAASVIKELQVKIPLWLKERDVPGAAVAVVDDKSILWQEVYGHTTRTKEKPVTPRTLFSIQSMSKSFSALGILIAVQDGLLELDAPITEYLPEFTVHSRFEEHPERKMTLRHLLAHRAGFTHEAPVGGNFDSRPHTFDEHILSISDTWLRYPVGYRYSYSNLGIDLAGYILEKRTGLPFAKFIREKIFIPLGMNDSTCDPQEIRKAEDRAIGHVSPLRVVYGGIPVEIPMIPAGGVYTNILDMAQYLMFHINKGSANGKQILKKELVEEMHRPAFPEKRQRYGYGLGLDSDGVSQTSYVQHGGGGYGFISFMAIYPELKLGVVTLTNSEESAVDGSRVTAVVNELIEKKMGPTKPWSEKPAIKPEDLLSPGDERNKKIVGFYGNNISIGLKDGVLGISIDKDFYPLSFYLDQGEIVGLFGNNSELRVKPSLLDQPGTLIHLNRLTGRCLYYDFHKPESPSDQPGPDKPEWKSFLGSYRSLAWGRSFGSLFSLAIVDGYMSFNGARCREHLPGFFFTFEGEAVDFRGTIPTFRNIMLIRTKK